LFVWHNTTKMYRLFLDTALTDILQELIVCLFYEQMIRL